MCCGRFGLLFAALAGVVQSIVCLIAIFQAMTKISSNKSLAKGEVHQLLFKSAVRLIFIQSIDIIVIGTCITNLVGIAAETVNSIYFTVWWYMLAGTFDNCRALIMFIDLLMTKLETAKSKSTSHTIAQSFGNSELKSGAMK